MTVEQFRRLALALPEATEGRHMDHPDFRVGGRIFATLWPDRAIGVLLLTSEQQSGLVASHPAVFAPVAGGWGRRGATEVDLRSARVAVLEPALLAAWRNRAPQRLAPRGPAAEPSATPSSRRTRT